MRFEDEKISHRISIPTRLYLYFDRYVRVTTYDTILVHIVGTCSGAAGIVLRWRVGGLIFFLCIEDSWSRTSSACWWYHSDKEHFRRLYSSDLQIQIKIILIIYRQKGFLFPWNFGESYGPPRLHRVGYTCVYTGFVVVGIKSDNVSKCNRMWTSETSEHHERCSTRHVCIASDDYGNNIIIGIHSLLHGIVSVCENILFRRIWYYYYTHVLVLNSKLQSSWCNMRYYIV